MVVMTTKFVQVQSSLTRPTMEAKVRSCPVRKIEQLSNKVAQSSYRLGFISLFSNTFFIFLDSWLGSLVLQEDTEIYQEPGEGCADPGAGSNLPRAA